MKGTHIITVTGCVCIEKLRSDAVKTAKEIGYPQKTIDDIWVAQNQTQINNILADARHKWDVKPGRVYKDKNGKPSNECNVFASEDSCFLHTSEEQEMA